MRKSIHGILQDIVKHCKFTRRYASQLEFFAGRSCNDPIRCNYPTFSLFELSSRVLPTNFTSSHDCTTTKFDEERLANKNSGYSSWQMRATVWIFVQFTLPRTGNCSTSPGIRHIVSIKEANAGAHARSETFLPRAFFGKKKKKKKETRRTGGYHSREIASFQPLAYLVPLITASNNLIYTRPVLEPRHRHLCNIYPWRLSGQYFKPD